MKLRWQHKEEKTSVIWLQRYFLWPSSSLLFFSFLFFFLGYLAVFCFIFLLGLFCVAEVLLILW